MPLGLISNFLTNQGNKRRERDARRFNLKLWHMENAYNHPKEQMARLEEAGLNPHMIYGTSPSSAVGTAGKAAPGKAPEYKIDNPIGDILAATNIKNTEAQTDNLKAQNKVIAQEAILKGVEIFKKYGEGRKAGAEADVAEGIIETSIEAAKENLRSLEQDTIRKEIENFVADESSVDRIMEIWYRAQAAEETLDGIKLENERKRLVLELNRMGIETTDNLFMRIFGRFFDNIKQAVDSGKYRSKLFKN